MNTFVLLRLRFTETSICVAGYEYAQDVLELPSDLLDCIVMNLPPLALQNIHELSVSSRYPYENELTVLFGVYVKISPILFHDASLSLVPYITSLFFFIFLLFPK